MRSSAACKLQRQLLLAELAHQLGLVLDQDDLALADDADAVGHLLGLVDVVRGQDDRHAGCRAARAPASHMSRRSSTSTPAVGSSRNRICGSCDSALAISRRRFMPPDSVMILLSFLSHSDRSFSTFSMCAGLARLAEQAAAEGHGRPHRFEGVGRQFLRHEADHRARGAVVGDDVVAVDEDAAGGRIDDAADDADQRRLAGAVRAEQREDFAAPDAQVDVLQRLEAGRVGLREVRYGDDRLHGTRR